MGTPPPPRADHSNAWSRFLWRNSSWCPAWTSPGAALGHLLLPCCWLSGRRGWLPPGHTLLPGTSREGDKVPLSLLQAEHPRLPQPLPVGLVRQTLLPQLGCPSLDSSSPVPVSPHSRCPSLPAPRFSSMDGSGRTRSCPDVSLGMPSGCPPSGCPHRPSLPFPALLRSHCSASIHPFARPPFLHLANLELVVQVQLNLVGKLKFCGELHH